MNYPSIRIEGERRRLVSMATYRDTAGACRVLAVLAVLSRALAGAESRALTPISSPAKAMYKRLLGFSVQGNQPDRVWTL